MDPNAVPKKPRLVAPFAPLRHRDFAKVWSAGLISQTGDFLLLIGLPFFVYRLTGSVLATGTMFLAVVVPPIVVSSFAGVLVDRFSRKWTMVTTSVVLGVGLIPLLWVSSVGQLWIVYAVAVFEASVEPFFGPAEGALLPKLVGEGELVAANSLYGGSRQIARLIGSAAGGVVVGFWGLAGVAVGDSVSFFAAAGIVASLIEPGAPVARLVGKAREGVAQIVRRFQGEWVQGLQSSVRTPVARAMLVFTLLIGVGEGAVLTLLAPFILTELNGSAIDFGAFVGLQAVGGIAGALLGASVGRRRSPAWMLSRLAIVFALLDAVLFAYPVFVPVLWPALVLIVLVGLPATLMMAGYSTLLQTAVADGLRGRFLGAVSTASAAALVGGILLAGLLTGVIGIVPMLEVQVGAYLSGGALIAFLLDARRTTPASAAVPLEAGEPVG